MRGVLELVTAPSGDVVADSEVYDHLRLDTAGSPAAPVDATYVRTLRDVAVAHLDGAEGVLGRALLTQTWRLHLDQFPEGSWRGWERDLAEVAIVLPLPPLQSVTSISYVDADGQTQTLASSQYQVVNRRQRPSFVVEAVNGSGWPGTEDRPQAVTVTFVAGYGAAADVPAPIRQAILLLTAQWYEQRQPIAVGAIVNTLPFAVDALLEPLRVRSFG